MCLKAISCGRSTILRHVAFRNQQLVRNLFILGLSTVGNLPLATSDHLSNFVPSISDSVPASMGFSTKAIEAIRISEYAEIKDLPNHPEKLLIDVREPHEVKEGKIPTSINIPLGNVGAELELKSSPDVFQEKYGRSKPEVDSYIILHCVSGKRSQKAAEIVVGLGYKNVHNYVGSWNDWVKHEGLKETKNIS